MATSPMPIPGMSAAEFLALPPDPHQRGSLELLEGLMIITPSGTPRHSRIIGNLAYELTTWARGQMKGEVYDHPVDVQLAWDSVVIPDIWFVRRERLSIIGDKLVTGAPDLVVEVLSPGTRKKDLVIKRRIYEEAGVPEFWLIDPDALAAEVLLLRDGKYESLGSIPSSGEIRSPLLGDFAIPLSRVLA